MTVDYSAIGQRIQQRRKKLRQTQDNLAESLCVSVGYISQLERGAKVSLDTLSRIAEHLGCDIAELVSEVIPSQSHYLESELGELYRSMNEEQKNLLLQIAKVILTHTADSFEVR